MRSKITSTLTLLLLTTTGSFVVSSAAAHHSWAADYDLSRSTTITGTVSRVMFRNPHSAVMLYVEDDNGRRELWTVEWGSPQRLRERGVTERTLRQGDELLVTGNPHRNAKTRSLRALSVRGPDGNEVRDARSAQR